MLGITNVSNAPSIVLTNTSVSTWTALPSTGTDSDMKTQGYTYYASIPCNGISANTIAEVTFSEANAKSGNYASTCRTYANEIRVYSKVNTAITIPSIIVHSIVESYYAVDNSPPTSGKTTAITSGAVYDALLEKNPTIGIQIQNIGSTSIPAGEHGYGNMVVAKKGMYLVHITGSTQIGQTGWSQVGITKGGNLLTNLQNLYYQNAGTYKHSVMGLERFNVGDIVGVYRNLSVAVTETIVLSITFLGDF